MENVMWYGKYSMVWRMYHTRQNFGGRKFWRIWQILPNSPNFLVQLKKIDFEKLSYREYSPIYYLPIIANSSFTKILSRTVVWYGECSMVWRV